MSENEEKKTIESTDKTNNEQDTEEKANTAETSAAKEENKKSAETTDKEQTRSSAAETVHQADKTDTVPPVRNNAPKEKKEKGSGETPWKTIAIILASLIVGFCGGLLSGHLSAKSAIADFKEEQAESQSNNFPDFFREFGSQNGNGSNGESSGSTEQNTNKAALGIMVQNTEDGPEIVDFTAGTNASEAGLKKGDIITKVDDTEVSTVEDVRAAIADKEAGDIVSITVTRDGREQDPVKVKLIDNSATSEHSDFPDGSNIQG